MDRVEIELPTPRAPKVLSFKVDAYIDKRVEEAARRYGFDSKSSFVRFILCNVLLDLGELDPGDMHLCYMGMRLRKGADGEDPELLVALADVVAELRGLSVEDAASLIQSNIDMLRDIALA